MQQEIKNQYILMHKGIYILNELEQLEFDVSDYATTKRGVLQNMYAENMAELAGELISIRQKQKNETKVHML